MLTNKQHALIMELINLTVQRERWAVAQEITGSDEADYWIDARDHDILMVWNELNGGSND